MVYWPISRGHVVFVSMLGSSILRCCLFAVIVFVVVVVVVVIRVTHNLSLLGQQFARCELFGEQDGQSADRPGEPPAMQSRVRSYRDLSPFSVC